MIVGSDSVGEYIHNNRKYAGDTMHHTFAESDDLPISKPNMPKFDTYEKSKMHDISAKELRNELKKANLSTDGNVKDLHRRCKQAKPEIPTKKMYAKKVLVKYRRGKLLRKYLTSRMKSPKLSSICKNYELV